jgi:hypothetical protein
MPEIQSPDPARKLQKKYDLIGSSPAPFLSPELVPVVIVDDLSDESPGILFAISAGAFAGAVGVQFQSALVNPTGTGILVTDVRLYITREDATDQPYQVFRGGPALTTPLVEFWQDFRVVGAPSARVTMDTDAGAVTEMVATGGMLQDREQMVDLSRFALPDNGSKLHLLMVGTNNPARAYWTWGESFVTR